MTANQIAYWNLQESKRRNRADEGIREAANAETHRSNVARETETNRSNLANEAETHRANVARETETQRTNKVNESIKWGQLAETRRSNQVHEFETSRHNQTAEDETKRHNQMTETVTVKNALLEDDTKRYLGGINAGTSLAGTVLRIFGAALGAK